RPAAQGGLMRAATPAEEAACVGFLESVDVGLAPEVMGIQRLAVCERDGIAFACLASPEALALPGDLAATAEAGGLPIGTLEDGAFHLDLQGAVLIARHTRNQCVRVTEHAARLFLYGRNVLGD